MKELRLLRKPLFWLFSALVLIWLAIVQLPDQRLHLVFCDVGQGDAALISFRSTQVLIDGGPDNKILDCLGQNLPFWDREIEMVVLTHPEADHFTGLIAVAERYKVGRFMINAVVNDSPGFWEFYRAVLKEGVEVYSPQAGDKIRLGPMEFLVLWPEDKFGNINIWQRSGLLGQGSQKDASGGDPKDVLGLAAYAGKLNDTSIVLRLSFGNFDALFTGDIGIDIEKKVDWTRVGGRKLEVLKIAHHGSKYSTGEEFLQKIEPVLAVVSAGKNPWGHPTREVIKRLGNQAIRLLRTDQEEKIEIVSDGEKWGVRK